MNRFTKSWNFIGAVLGYLAAASIIGFIAMTYLIEYFNKF